MALPDLCWACRGQGGSHDSGFWYSCPFCHDDAGRKLGTKAATPHHYKDVHKTKVFDVQKEITELKKRVEYLEGRNSSAY